MTTKQIELVNKLASELGIEVNLDEVMHMNTQQASSYIEGLIAQRNKMNEGRASQRQIEMAKDMARCPLLKVSFDKELCVVPARWYEAKNALEQEYSACLKFLEKPYRIEQYTTFETLGEVLDKMFLDDLMSKEMYEEVFNMTSIGLQEARIMQLIELNDMEVQGHKIMKKIAFDAKEIKLMEMQSVKLANRIANANAKITELEENFDLSKVDRVTIAEWIENNRPIYVEWQNTRLTRNQFQFIKELQKRIANQIGNCSLVNEQGIRIERKKYVSLNECCLLTDDAILCFSKDFAQRYIQQLEKELYDATLSQVKNTEGTEETIIEEKRDKYADENTDEVRNAMSKLYAVIGQDADQESYELDDLKELMTFIPVILGNSKDVHDMINLCVSDVFSKEEIAEIMN